jgi:RHS repeat-associated protein
MGHRTDYAYDAMDRVTAVRRPALDDGQRPTTQFAYDAVGNTTVITGPNGFMTRYTYDASDNVVTIVDPMGGETSYTYDAEDTPVAVTDPNGHTETTTYNDVGLPVHVEDAMGYTTTMRYDDDYNMVEMVNAMGEVMAYTYDEQGRLLQTNDPLKNAITYTRDALGRVTQVTDANGHTTTYTYDALGQLITVTDALSGTTAYAYDAAGNLTVITDANGSMTRFEYNFLNQLKREINPLDNTWEYWYDAAGRLVRRRDAMWHATYYDYDSNGRMVEISYGVTPETMHPVTFTYDLAGNETQMCDSLGCTTHTYDALGRPTTTTDWLGRTITRTYDAASNLTGLTYPNGYQTQYTYNANDWLKRFADPHGDASVYTRNPLGQVTEIRHPNDTLARFSYDAAGRLTGIDNRKLGAAQPQSAYQYAMDKVGNRTQVVETRAPFDGNGDPVELVHAYEYDALDRLTSAGTDAPPSDTDYAFDPVGNRLSKTGTVLAPDPGVPELPVAPEPEATSYTYNAANQLTEVDGQTSTTALDYNANGDRVRETEVLTDGTTLITDYVYDREDRLTGVTKTVSDTAALTVTMVATYTYDGYGRRALKEVAYPNEVTSTQVFTYLYDGLDIIGAQLEQNGVVTETYYYLAPSPVTGLRRPVEMERLPNPATGFAGDRHWYQSDGLDSVVALTDESGDLAAPFLYDEYGQMLAGTTELQVFAYTGQDYDVETGLYHFYARYYDARTGTWLTQDTYRGIKGLAKTLHRYSYVGNNPTNNFDLLGYTESSCSGWDPGNCPASEAWGQWNQDNTGYYVYLNEGTTDRLTGSQEEFDQLVDEIGNFFSENKNLNAKLRLGKEQIQEQLSIVRDKALSDGNLSGANTIDFTLKYYPTENHYLWIRPWGNDFNPYGSETAASNWLWLKPTPEQKKRCGNVYGPPFIPETYKKFGDVTQAYKGQTHAGVDFSWTGIGGTAVVAVADGEVVIAGWDPSPAEFQPGYGYMVKVKHYDGHYSLYAHLKEGSITVKEKQKVVQGQKLGEVGNTGKSTGDHLHFEIRKQSGLDSADNPFNWIP